MKMRSITHTGFPPALHLARRKPLRAMLSGLLVIAVLLSALQPLVCLGDDESPAPDSSISVAIEKSAPLVNGDKCLSGQCHCVCHVSVQAWTDLVSSPIDFGHLAYPLRTDHLPRALAAFPPFEPPRA